MSTARQGSQAGGAQTGAVDRSSTADPETKAESETPKAATIQSRTQSRQPSNHNNTPQPNR